MAKSFNSRTCSACGLVLTPANQSAALVKNHRKLCSPCDAKRKAVYAPKYAERSKVRRAEARGDQKVNAVLSSKRVALRKLTAAQALEAFELVNAGWRRATVAKRFDVCKSSIYQIMRGNTWGHVTGLTCKRHTWKTELLIEGKKL